MKKILYPALFLMVVLMAGLPELRAQNLASLPDDPAVSTGKLPDGIVYFIVSNPSRKGVADLSLVWRAGEPASVDSLSKENTVCADTLAEIAGRCLAGTEVFSDRTPEAFLRGSGIQCGKSGFIQTRDDAVIFNFRNLSMARGEAVIDSLLLLSFDLSKSYSAMLKEAGLKDCGQAIIISGDINPGSVQGKMRMLSMFVPEIEGGERVDNYTWKEKDTASFYVIKDTTATLATVSACYSAPRIPREYMKTVLPVVSSRMGNELGEIVNKRLSKEFSTLGIPVADIDYKYVGSADWGGDEKYEFYVKTAPENIESVIPVMSSVLSDIATRGVSYLEYSEVRKAMGRRMFRQAGSPIKDNDVYINRCIASFLHGSSLSSSVEMGDFFESSALSDSDGNKFFNKFAASLLDRTDNLVFGYKADTCTVGLAELESVFTKSRDNGFSSVVTNHVNLDDTTGFSVFAERCKIRREKQEPLSGGKLWVFANGMKVVFKKTPSAGRFWYSMIIRGGTASVHDMQAGHGAYYADMLKLFNVREIRPDDFHYLLSAKDIDIKYRVGTSDMGIYGSAPSSSLDFLLKALVGITKSNEVNEKAFDYYLECERLGFRATEDSRQARYVAIDSLMCPGYNYSVFKSDKGLSVGLKEEAEQFFAQQFAKVNDGVFVIVGDINEYELKKKLQEYLGAFSVTSRIMPRPGLTFQPISGESTYILDGRSTSVDVAMSAPVQLTVSNYMAAKLAALAVKDAVLSKISGLSAVLTVSDFFSVLPRDRFNLMITVEEGSRRGFSDRSVPFLPVSVLVEIRSVLEDLGGGSLQDDKLAVYKSMLKNTIASYEADPRYWVDMITRRFSDGKDLHSDYVAKIDGVTADQVREMIELLNGSGKVEYVVRP